VSFTSLMDGGLSVQVAGAEYAGRVHGLEWESTNQGDGAASFWFEPDDPFHPQTDFPSLRHGAKVEVEHTLGGVTTRLYSGFIISDPRSGSATEAKTVTVECGGPLEVAKSRTDMGFIFTDPDTAQWFANKKSPKCFSMSNTGGVSIGVAEGTKVPHDRAGIIGAVAYNGAVHLLGILSGYKRITGVASWDLRDHMNAALLWWPAYKASLDNNDYHVIHQWTANSHQKDKPFDYAINQSGSGAGYVALAMWSNRAGGTKTTDERGVELDDVVLYTDLAQKRIDQAMLSVAQLIGLSPAGSSVSPIGNLMPGLVARPFTDPASALATFAAQADQIVEWGYWSDRFVARYLERSDAVIRALPNCYLVDATDGDVLWDVAPRQETARPRSVRLLYGHGGQSAYPPGSPASVIAPGTPGWGIGTPFMGTTAPVLTVDFSGHNMSDEQARRVANKLADHLGLCESSGPVGLRCPTVPVYGGGSRPAPYIHGGDWIESEQGDAGPLYVVRAHVSADTGYVDLDVGLSEDQLIDQLTAAGSTTAVPLHKPYRRRR
jgi:hypothetical protein